MKKPCTFKEKHVSKIGDTIRDKLHKENDLSQTEKIYDVLINVLPALIVDTIIEYDKSKDE